MTGALRREGIETVIWAIGYRRDYTWLKLPVLDAHGEIRHDGGITPRPGLYALGLRFKIQYHPMPQGRQINAPDIFKADVVAAF